MEVMSPGGGAAAAASKAGTARGWRGDPAQLSGRPGPHPPGPRRWAPPRPSLHARAPAASSQSGCLCGAARRDKRRECAGPRERAGWSAPEAGKVGSPHRRRRVSRPGLSSAWQSPPRPWSRPSGDPTPARGCRSRVAPTFLWEGRSHPAPVSPSRTSAI